MHPKTKPMRSTGILTTIIVLIAAASAFVDVVPPTTGHTIVHPAVHRKLRRQGTVNIFVRLHEGTGRILYDHQEAGSDRGSKIETLVRRLEEHADQSQGEITQWLAQQAGGALESGVYFSSLERYWICNEIYFRGATPELLDKLIEMGSVAEIYEEPVITLPPQTATNSSRRVAVMDEVGTDEIQWNIRRVGAPEVWAEGYNGQGVVVGSIDDGVWVDHPLLPNFRGDYGWFDPILNKTTPTNTRGHGTHTTGIAVGHGGIGVAPGATWMMCRGCYRRQCEMRHIMRCFEFLLCPTDPLGAHRDCSKAPRVINNSWGFETGSGRWFKKVISAWRAAGIIPVFANGNSGSMCQTTEGPAELPNVLGVGATAADGDALWVYSSRGPARNTATLKPDLSAPGVDVQSAFSAGGMLLRSDTGTSFAAPHVTGAIALLLSVEPTLTYDEIYALLTTTADSTPLSPVDDTCGNATTNGAFPNNDVGHGRLNVLRAFRRLIETRPTPGPSPPQPPQAPVAAVSL